jgi:hypothetical protein
LLRFDVIEGGGKPRECGVDIAERRLQSMPRSASERPKQRLQTAILLE